MTRLVFVACLALAACGAAGPPDPVAPTSEREPGIDVSGTVEIGIVGGDF